MRGTRKTRILYRQFVQITQMDNVHNEQDYYACKYAEHDGAAECLTEHHRTTLCLLARGLQTARARLCFAQFAGEHLTVLDDT